MSAPLSRSTSDSEIRGPIPHQRTAIAIVSIASVTGALLAFGFQRSIGLIPLWAPILFVPLVVTLAFFLGRGRLITTSPRNHTGKTLELDSIYAHAPLGLCSLDQELRVSRINHAMARLFGRSTDQILGNQLAERAPHLVEAWLPQLEAALRNTPGPHYVEFSSALSEDTNAFQLWGATFFPIVGNDGASRGVSVVAEDLTEERRLSEEHRAHQVILELAATLAPLDKLIEALASSLETIFPSSLTYVIKRDDRGRGVSLFPRASLPWLSDLFTPALSTLESNDVLNRCFDPPHEVIIADTSHERDSAFCQSLHQRGIRSCWITPITLAKGEAWGACVINHRTISLNPTESERKHLDALLRLISAVIERHSLHERLASTTERFECAERAGKIGVFDWNPISGTIVWTRQMERLFGLDEGAFEGNFAHWRRLIDPSDAHRVLTTIKQLVAHRESWFASEYRFTHPSGELRWMEVQGSLTYDSRGSPLRGIGVASDITERKRVEQRARRDQERLSLALEAGALGFWDWHIPSGHVQFGGTWAAMLGYSLEDIEPSLDSWIRLVHPDDLPEARRALDRHFRRETPIYECEHRLRKSDGSWTWVLDRGRVVEWDETGNPIRALGIHADITEQRAVRDALKTASARKDEFLATLAHELRNPLAPIRTGLQIIRRDPFGEKATQAREMMERQLNHMVRLVDDLLDVSRITRGQLELKKERVSIQEVLTVAIECSMPAINLGGQRFHQDIPSEILNVHGDTTRLAQIVSNLLVNAAKYTPADGEIELVVRAEDSRVVIRVTDTGAGIPANMLESVFEMFSQVNQTLDRSFAGGTRYWPGARSKNCGDAWRTRTSG